MILLDTHAWVWWEGADSQLSRSALDAIESAEHVGISCISIWEVAMLVERKRMGLHIELNAWFRHAVSSGRVEVFDIAPSVAITAARIPRTMLRDPADRLIAATAIVHGLSLVSRDREIQSLPELSIVW